MTFHWKDEIGDLLGHYDILGATGCHFGHSHKSLLVNIQDWELCDSHLTIHFDQLTPEGWGLEYYPQDVIEIPRDGPLNQSMVLLWDIQQAPPDRFTPIWILGLSECDVFSGFDFHTTSSTIWLHATGARHTYGTLRILELCSGGFGGWRAGIQFLGEASERVTSTIAVDNDLQASTAYALSHKAILLKSAPDRNTFVQPASPLDWVLVASVTDQSWWPAIAKWQPHIITISAPCQPWSNAAHGDGLTRADGQLLLHCILMSRYFRPPVLLLEQVLGFAQHPHKPWIIRALHMIGYKLVFDKCMDLQDQSATTRVRWIGIATRVPAQLPTIPMPPWPRFEYITVQQMNPNIDIPDKHRPYLEINEQIKCIAQSVRFFRGNRNNLTPEALLASRIHTDQPKVPTFMASYGSQHLFDEDYLSRLGYFGHFRSDATFPFGFRFWHPAEALILHGILGPAYIDADFRLAWKHMGNQISLPHAILPLLYAFNLLTPSDFSLYPTFAEYHDQRKQGDQMSLWPVGDGFLLSETPPEQEFIGHASVLLKAVKEDMQFHAWSPTAGLIVDSQGLDTICQLTDTHPGDTSPMSPVLSEPSQLSMTDQFVPVLPISLSHDAGVFDFWISADLPWHHAEAVWYMAFKVHTATLKDSTCKPVLLHCQDNMNCEQIFYPLVITQGGSVSIIANLANLEILKHPALKSQTKWWDQFGPIAEYQINQPHTLILPEPLQFVDNMYLDLQLYTLFQVSNVSHQWISKQDLYVLTFEGDLVAQSILASVVSGLFSHTTLEQLGRKLTKHQTDHKCVLVFEPQKGSCPPHQFGHALAIAAARVCLTNTSFHMQTAQQLIPIVIKWETRVLWRGHWNADWTVGDLLQYLTAILSIAIHRDISRIISRGAKISDEVKLSTLEFSKHHDAVALHLAPALHGGGGPTTKNSQRTLHKNAIAAVLLEQGYDIQWTSKAVEQLTSQFGIPKLQAATSQPMGHQKLAAVKQLCSEAGITMPSFEKPTSGKNHDGAPWNKSKKSKTGELQIQSHDFQILPGFFLNADGTDSPVITHLRGQTTGICLLTPEQAAPWISANQKISPDELGGVIVGKLPNETTLSHEPIVVPCINRDKQQVLLSGVLVQFGGKAIKYQQGDSSKINAETSHLVAITLFNSDWTIEQWQEATRSPNQFIQRALEEDSISGAITAMWGKSLRAGRTPAAPGQATSMQVHVTVAEAHLSKLLSRSGFNKVYCTPKTTNGRLDSDYKVIWISGDVTKAITVAATTSHCMGLIRGKDHYGLRYTHANFSAAWQVINPGQKEPTKMSGDKIFKVDGLPFGSTQTMMQQWLQYIKWTAEPIKALGPQAWLLRSDDMPPPGLIMFNSSPVLVRLLPPRNDNSKPVLVGPRPKPVAHTEASTAANSDPWALWQGPRPQPPATRTLEGPLEKRLGEQDDKIQALQKDMEKMAVNQRKFEDHTHKCFREAEDRDKQNVEQMHTAMKGLQKDLETSLTKSMQANAQAMQDQLRDLKSLFTSHANKRKPEATDMEP